MSTIDQWVVLSLIVAQWLFIHVWSFLNFAGRIMSNHLQEFIMFSDKAGWSLRNPWFKALLICMPWFFLLFSFLSSSGSCATLHTSGFGKWLFKAAMSCCSRVTSPFRVARAQSCLPRAAFSYVLCQRVFARCSFCGSQKDYSEVAEPFLNCGGTLLFGEWWVHCC